MSPSTRNVPVGEDAQRQRDRNGAANLAVLRRLALNLLRRETSAKLGLRKKSMQCAFDTKYLLKVLASAQI